MLLEQINYDVGLKWYKACEKIEGVNMRETLKLFALMVLPWNRISVDTIVYSSLMHIKFI